MNCREHRGFGGKTVAGSAIICLALLFQVFILHGQDVPSKPLSIPIYHPMLLNPAFVGSKDFTNISLTTRALKSPDSQVLNFHKRLIHKSGEYSSLGLGAMMFQEQFSSSWNAGAGVALSYHFALDDKTLHNLSIGVTGKGILTVPKNQEEVPGDSSGAVFIPDADFGVYYYGPDGFGGLSVTSLFGENAKDDTLGTYSVINRQFHLYGGYKFVLSKENRIVIEPSLLVTMDGKTITELHKHLVPYLKLYLQNFYIGTYLKDFDTFSLFFQYQFPKLYAGVFLEFPRVGYLNDDNIIFEVSVGVNLGKEGSNFLKYRHW